MSEKLSTKNIKTGGGGIPKILQPGNAVCTITAVELKEFTFKPGAYNILLSLEGPDLGDEFEGFFMDKDNESKGRHKGQVGQVKAGEWAFADGETKSGIVISRNDEILKFMKNLCSSLGIDNWLVSQDDKHDTIESLMEAFNKDKPFKGKAINFCIAGKEYLNKGGYTTYELYLPKYSKEGGPFGTKVLTFNPLVHIKKSKVTAVSEFGEDPSTSISSDSPEFDLDGE